MSRRSTKPAQRRRRGTAFPSRWCSPRRSRHTSGPDERQASPGAQSATRRGARNTMIVVLGGSEAEREALVGQLAGCGLEVRSTVRLSVAEGLPDLMIVTGPDAAQL